MTIPTKTDDSLGRVKTDLAPAPNLDNYVPAAEHERIKDAIIANAEAVAAVGSPTLQEVLDKGSVASVVGAVDVQSSAADVRLRSGTHGLRVTDAGVTTLEHDGDPIVEVSDVLVDLKVETLIRGLLVVLSGVYGRVPVIPVPGTTHTPEEAQSGAIYRCTHADGCEVTIPDTLPVGWTASFVQRGAAAVTFVGGGKLVLSRIEGVDAETAELHAMVTVTVLAADDALLTGQLAETA